MANADHDNHHDNSHLPQILAVQTIVLVLAVVCVALRMYVRIKMIKSIGRDDWVMAGSALCSIGTWILFVYQSFHGLGRHIGFISAEDQAKLREASFWQVIISSCLGIALLKISIALNLLRLSPSRWYTWCLWVSIAFVAAYSFMGAMTFFCFCKPMEAFWDQTITNAKCYSVHLFITFALINTAFNIFTDVLFATIPIPIIWKLQMKRKIRLYLIGVLSLGYVAVAFGVTNGVYQISYSSDVDQYFNDSILFFAVLQVNTGMIAACVPSLKPLVSKALKLSDYTNSNSRMHGNYYSSNQYGSRYGSRYVSQRDQYALEELHSDEDRKISDSGVDAQSLKDQTVAHSATATALYQSSSEEMILGSQPSSPHVVNSGDRNSNGRKGIFVTTEINVH